MSFLKRIHRSLSRGGTLPANAAGDGERVLPEGTVKHEGMLTYHARVQSRRCWFVLIEDKLYCFKDEKEKHSVIDLERAQYVMKARPKSKGYGIKIVTAKGRTLSLVADTEEERDTWIQHLMQTIGFCAERRSSSIRGDSESDDFFQRSFSASTNSSEADIINMSDGDDDVIAEEDKRTNKEIDLAAQKQINGEAITKLKKPSSNNIIMTTQNGSIEEKDETAGEKRSRNKLERMNHVAEEANPNENNSNVHAKTDSNLYEIVDADDDEGATAQVQTEALYKNCATDTAKPPEKTTVTFELRDSGYSDSQLRNDQSPSPDTKMAVFSIAEVDKNATGDVTSKQHSSAETVPPLVMRRKNSQFLDTTASPDTSSTVSLSREQEQETSSVVQQRESTKAAVSIASEHNAFENNKPVENDSEPTNIQSSESLLRSISESHKSTSIPHLRHSLADVALADANVAKLKRLLSSTNGDNTIKLQSGNNTTPQLPNSNNIQLADNHFLSQSSFDSSSVSKLKDFLKELDF